MSLIQLKLTTSQNEWRFFVLLAKISEGAFVHMFFCPYTVSLLRQNELYNRDLTRIIGLVIVCWKLKIVQHYS